METLHQGGRWWSCTGGLMVSFNWKITLSVEIQPAVPVKLIEAMTQPGTLNYLDLST